MKRILLLLAVVCGCCVARCDYGGVLTNMVAALNRSDGMTNPSVTNLLAVARADVSNSTLRANIDLVLAISMADISDKELVGDALIPHAVVICSNVLSSAQLSPNAWQKGAAGVVLSGIYKFDGMYQAAFWTATNTLSLSVSEATSGEDVLLWDSIANHLTVPGLSITEALRYSAAEALLIEDPSSFVVPYTNGLPESILLKLRSVFE